MTRVQGIVQNSIKVALADIKPGDILSITNGENDPIIDSIEKEDGKYRFHYRPGAVCDVIRSSAWLDPEIGNFVFVHDLFNERAEYHAEAQAS